MKIILVCGARPNFVKIAPLLRAIEKHNAQKLGAINPPLVHTGQHYDYQMSQVFFQDLELPEPDIYLGIGGGTHAEQTGKILTEIENVLLKEKPMLVVVVGDVNSTLAAALASVKLNIPVAHVEAGLRSFDRSMPEEINRLLTDAISDYLFTPSRDGDQNLLNEGIPKEKIFFVGNVMVDSLLYCKPKAEKSNILQTLDIKEKGYALLTLHRPANVDDSQKLAGILQSLKDVSEQIPLVFPAHPRTKINIEKFGLGTLIKESHISLIEPVGYIDFLALQMYAKFVLTDSGGIQEETTVFGVPCLTLRDSTERPVTITQGTNTLISSTAGIKPAALEILNGAARKGSLPELWDGKAAERILEVIAKIGQSL